MDLAPTALALLASRGVEPAAVEFDGALHYVNSAGTAVPVLRFDNGADHFVEGLARTVKDGKVGFIDERLHVVIAPRWDFAFPFHHGTAVVCDGCSPSRLGGEHTSVVGGRWGVIDRHGALVVPIVHSAESMRALRER